MDTADTPPIPAAVLATLRCPVMRCPLRQEGTWLIAEAPAEAPLRYPIREGIPILLMDEAELPEGVDSLDAFKAKYAAEIAG